MQTQYLQRMLIGLGLVLALAVPRAPATDYYVTTNGTGGGTSWTDASSNLIGIVAAAGNNDTVYVTNNATYWLTNQITVASATTVRSWGPGGIYDPTNTILSGRYPDAINRHFTLNNAGATVAGFMLTKGYENCGGSIYLQNGMVTNCIIVSNVTYTNNGGGVYMLTGSGGVWNCTISGNIASNVSMSGGGINVASGGPWRIANCTISGNSATNGSGGGGGINAVASTGTIISNCWIVSNQGGYAGGAMYLGGATECHNSFIIGNKVVRSPDSFGGGVRLTGSSMLRNCLVVNNSALASSGYAGGVYINNNVLVQSCTIASNVCQNYGGGIYCAGTPPNVGFPKVENTIIWGNSGSVYSNWASGASNSSETWITFTNCCVAPNIYSNSRSFASAINLVTNDPRFVNNATDFRLQSDSPCINAGVHRGWMENAWDVYGNRRLDNFRKIVDIGAYEYLSKGTLFRGH